MLRITDHITIDERELEEQFVRSSGPGGQNVNKLETAVQLRFDVRHSPIAAARRAGAARAPRRQRLTKDGVLVIIAQRHRTQERNRQDALDRLIELIQRAAVAPKRRAARPGRPPAPASAAWNRRSAAAPSRACGRPSRPWNRVGSPI